MNNLSDSALVMGLRSKDAAITKQFMEQYWQDSVRFALSLTGDYNAAEDIAQDALLLTLERIDTFKKGRAFRPWFLKIVENRAREYMRGERRRKARDRQEKAPRRVEAPVQSLEEKEQADLLREHLSKLDDDCRTILSLRFIESLSLRDISQSMNCPEGTVSTKIRRGLEHLSRSLSPVLSVTPVALGPLLARLGSTGNIPSIESTITGADATSPLRIPAAALRGKLLSAGLVIAILPFVVLTTLLVTEAPPPALMSFQEDPFKASSNRGRGKDAPFQGRFIAEKDKVAAASNLQADLERRESQEKLARSSTGGSATGEGRPGQDSRLMRLRGRFVDPSQRPLSQFRFRLYRVSEDREVQIGDFQSDSYGEQVYSFDEDEQVLGEGERIELRGERVPYLSVLDLSKVVDGELDLGTVVIGEKNLRTVVARVEFNGQAVVGADVTFLRQKEGETREGRALDWLHKELSDENGKAAWYRNFPVDVEFSVQIEVLAKGFAYLKKSFPVKAGHNEAVIQLTKAAPFSGYVVDSSGHVVSGATIHAEGIPQWVESDAAGNFELDHLTFGLNYSLTITPPEKGTSVKLIQKITADGTRRRFSLGTGGEVEVRLRMPEGIEYEGVMAFFLVGKTKDGLELNRLVQYDDWPVKISNVPAGRYVLSGMPFGKAVDGESKEFQVDDRGRTIAVTIEYKRGRKVSGRFVNQHGEPLKLDLNLSRGSGLSLKTDAEGRFHTDCASHQAFSIRVFQRFGRLVKTFKVKAGRLNCDLGTIIIDTP